MVPRNTTLTAQRYKGVKSGYQAPFPLWIVPPHYTKIQGHQRSSTPFREDPRHQHTSVSPPHQNPHKREPARGSVPQK